MKKTFRWIKCGVLMTIIGVTVTLVACGGQAMPAPVAATNTPLPPAPTEAPTSTPLPTATDTPPPPPTATATSTPQPVSTEAAEKPVAELAEAVGQIYTANNCVACHGANYEGGFGSILAGLPAERIQSVTRSGEPEAGMPAFDQEALSDDELSALSEFLSGLTLQDIGVELPPVVVDHLSQAREALQAGDEADVEAYLKEAQEAGAEAPPGVQTTLKSLVEGLGKDDWVESTQVHLEVLLGQ
jgi:mono/diheme cytochrome c family protein